MTKRTIEHPDLFVSGALLDQTMTRQPDHATSEAAAAKVRVRIGELHLRVYAALKLIGPATDEQLKAYFDKVDPGRFAESTIRKRRGELRDAQHVVEDGEARNARGDRMKRWRAV